MTTIAAARTGRHGRAIRLSVQMINTCQRRRFGCLKGRSWMLVKVRWCNTIVCIGWSTRLAKYKESISRWYTDIKNMLEANKTNRLSTSRVWMWRRICRATRCSTLRIWLELWGRMASKINRTWPRDIRDHQVNHASSTSRSWHLWRMLHICNKTPK